MRTTEARDAQESALPCALSQARQNGERMGIAPLAKRTGIWYNYERWQE